MSWLHILHVDELKTLANLPNLHTEENRIICKNDKILSRTDRYRRLLKEYLRNNENLNEYLHNRFREAHSRNLWLLDIPFSTLAPFLETPPTANNVPEDSFLETDEEISEIELHQSPELLHWQSTDPPLTHTR